MQSKLQGTVQSGWIEEDGREYMLRVYAKRPHGNTVSRENKR